MASTADAATHDPTSPFVREVIELFREEAFAQVRFPDVDCDMLLAAQRALLETQLELERCEAQLAAAREALVAQLESIEGKAERALAYARVFASGDPVLTNRLAELGRKKPAASGERAPPRRRGRPRKEAQAGEAAELFAETTPTAAPAADGGEGPATAPEPAEPSPPLIQAAARRKRVPESLSL